MALIAGKSVQEISDKTDEQVVSKCVQVLRKMFPEQVSSLRELFHKANTLVNSFDLDSNSRPYPIPCPLLDIKTLEIDSIKQLDML